MQRWWRRSIAPSSIPAPAARARPGSRPAPPNLDRHLAPGEEPAKLAQHQHPRQLVGVQPRLQIGLRPRPGLPKPSMVISRRTPGARCPARSIVCATHCSASGSGIAALPRGFPALSRLARPRRNRPFRRGAPALGEVEGAASPAGRGHGDRFDCRLRRPRRLRQAAADPPDRRPASPRRDPGRRLRRRPRAAVRPAPPASPTPGPKTAGRCPSGCASRTAGSAS